MLLMYSKTESIENDYRELENEFDVIVKEFHDVIPCFDDRDYVKHYKLKLLKGAYSIDYFIIDIVLFKEPNRRFHKRYCFKELIYGNDSDKLIVGSTDRFEKLVEFLRENKDIIRNGQLVEYMKL